MLRTTDCLVLLLLPAAGALDSLNRVYWYNMVAQQQQYGMLIAGILSSDTKRYDYNTNDAMKQTTSTIPVVYSMYMINNIHVLVEQKVFSKEEC